MVLQGWSKIFQFLDKTKRCTSRGTARFGSTSLLSRTCGRAFCASSTMCDFLYVMKPNPRDLKNRGRLFSNWKTKQNQNQQLESHKDNIRVFLIRFLPLWTWISHHHTVHYFTPFFKMSLEVFFCCFIAEPSDEELAMLLGFCVLRHIWLQTWAKSFSNFLKTKTKHFLAKGRAISPNGEWSLQGGGPTTSNSIFMYCRLIMTATKNL